MNRVKRNSLVGGTMLSAAVAFIVLCSLYLRIPGFAAAQNEFTPTSPRITRSTTPVTTTTPIATGTATPELVTYTDLVKHFERVTDRILSIFTVVIAASGVIGAYFGLKGWKDIQELDKEINTLKTRHEELEQGQTLLGQELEHAEARARTLTNRLRYVLEIRDRNAEVRLRAAQQLGASNDIFAVSHLIELLETEEVADVRVEAVYGLGQLLGDGGEPGALAEGIKALIAATKDADEKVRRESVEALDTLVCSNVQLPRTAIQRLRELINHDKFDDVVEAAKIALEHVKKQREGKLDSHKGDPTVT